MKKFLIIQTAFIGDAILATAVLEKIHAFYPKNKIDILVRKGNEELFADHPYINECIVWKKSEGKYKSLLSTVKIIRKNQYSHIINLHRFASSGFLTAFSGAKEKIGFDKNPFSFLFTKKIKHQIGNGKHEIERNQLLIEHLTDTKAAHPKLYPSNDDESKIKNFIIKPFVCISPSSVWFTKQLPKEKWIELISNINSNCTIYLLGGKNDKDYCDEIIKESSSSNTINLCGKLNLLQSAALMQKAEMNFVNDSAPLHLCSATNAPVTAFFCSTVPEFGFGPLSEKSFVVQTLNKLDCRPCGLHGYKNCPKGNFKCGNEIIINQTLIPETCRK
ncbi:MAG: glycosyltransferase family 9 protein [Bacteroidia bacterium]